ncbi:transposase [Streptomyces sp. NPDC052101]|uniref:transposase n=1 Tax=Streptomyces sp. NPDC052101 TaxID=3155763 RepID=UPI003426BBA6
MLSRGDLTDDDWAVLEPLLTVSNNRRGRWRDHREVINGIIHRLGTSCQWRELPERFGPWKTVHKRHLLWSADGTWEQLLQQVQAVSDAAGDIDWDVNVDSTSVRAHRWRWLSLRANGPTAPSSSRWWRRSACPARDLADRAAPRTVSVFSASSAPPSSLPLVAVRADSPWPACTALMCCRPIAAW